MVKPYVALALQASHWTYDTGDVNDTQRTVDKNLDELEKQIAFHVALNSYEYPVRLVALSEGYITGWKWAIGLTATPSEYASTEAMQVPGPITDRLGQIAKAFNIFIRFQASVVEPEWPTIVFNKAFIIDNKGELILSTYKHHESYPIASTATPHDVWDEWEKKYIEDPTDWQQRMDALYPVVDTEIGRLGTLICGQHSYPEEGRGLAMNGAEVIIKCSYQNPWVSQPNGYDGTFTLLSRMHALVNTAYTVSPCGGTMYYNDTPHTLAGYSNICDYQGRVLTQLGGEVNAAAAAIVDIEALRRFRKECVGITTTQMALMRTENFRLIYDQPIYPKNQLTDMPYTGQPDVKERIHQVAGQLIERGVWAEPSI